MKTTTIIISLGFIMLLLWIFIFFNKKNYSEEKIFQSGKNIFWANCRYCHNRDNIKINISKYKNDDDFCKFLFDSTHNEYLKPRLSTDECLILYNYIIHM